MLTVTFQPSTVRKLTHIITLKWVLAFHGSGVVDLRAASIVQHTGKTCVLSYLKSLLQS